MPSGRTPKGASGSPDPDADILPGLAAQEQAALRVLMERHLRSLKSLAWHLLKDDWAAEDIAQEVFLKTWQQAPSWETGNAKLVTWMRRVATNLCLDRLRKKKEDLPGEVPDIADDKASALSGLMEQDGKSRIEAALAALPERQKAAVVLCHYQECSQVEAAEILALSVRAYESLLARARRNLKEMLADDKHDLMSNYRDAL